MKIQNLSGKTIDEIQLALLTFDSFGKPLRVTLHEDNVSYLRTTVSIAPGQTQDSTWELTFDKGSKKIKVIVGKVHFTDDSVWENSKYSEQVYQEKGIY